MIPSSKFLIHCARLFPFSSYITPRDSRSARFLIPDSYFPPPHIAQGALRRALCYYLTSVCFLFPSEYFAIRYLPPPCIAQGALRRALCYISKLPPSNSCSRPRASYLLPPSKFLLDSSANFLPHLSSPDSQGALRRSLCYISSLPPLNSCSPLPASCLPASSF